MKQLHDLRITLYTHTRESEAIGIEAQHSCDNALRLAKIERYEICTDCDFEGLGALARLDVASVVWDLFVLSETKGAFFRICKEIYGKSPMDCRNNVEILYVSSMMIVFVAGLFLSLYIY